MTTFLCVLCAMIWAGWAVHRFICGVSDRLDEVSREM